MTTRPKPKTGGYTCIVADPPWEPRDKLPGKTRGAVRQYEVMNTAALCGLADVGACGGLRIMREAVADDAILFLWRLASMQQDALDVAFHWGFRVTSEIVWNKLTKNGKVWFGMGRTVRAAHETCLVCVRGRSSRVIRNNGVRSTFEAPVVVDDEARYIHSGKPPEFFTQVVEPLVGDVRRIELFARTRRPGWDAIGNQLPALAGTTGAA